MYTLDSFKLEVTQVVLCMVAELDHFPQKVHASDNSRDLPSFSEMHISHGIPSPDLPHSWCLLRSHDVTQCSHMWKDPWILCVLQEGTPSLTCTRLGAGNIYAY